MFKNDKEKQSQSQTVIGPSVKVEGNLKGVGNLLIEGNVKGSISTDQDITVGSDAEVEANISASNATIAGKVNGAITVSGHLNVMSSAKIKGDVSTKTLAVESGAHLDGMVTMTQEKPKPLVQPENEHQK